MVVRPKISRGQVLLVLALLIIGIIVTVGAWLVARTHYVSEPSYQPPKTSSSPTKLSVGRVPDIPLTLPEGYAIHVFADQLGVARDLEFTPGGTLLVSNPTGANVMALPDRNHDGAADAAKVILRTNGNNPHGLAFHDGKLYVAETTRVTRYNWDEQALTATFDRELFKLPANGNHNRRTLLFGPDGRLYTSVGSTCNVCNETDTRSATIMVSDADGHGLRVFASGLRNAPFMALNPTSREVWSTEMGRDLLGDNLPPDEIDIIRDGQNYGWPVCYGNRVHDTNFDKRQYFADPCANTAAPIFQVPAHNAPLGLAFINSSQFDKSQQGDLLVSYHGSWNRTVPDGYKVVRLHVDGNSITSSTDFITGFISGRTVSARPVDLIFDESGNLYLSDDKTGTVYIIQKRP